MGCLTDVAGVRVGHVTLHEGEAPAATVRTGVTAILPHARDLRAEPVTAAVHVVNGYGKPVGLTQVAELGELEAPVLLTGTFGVGAAHEGALRWLMGRDPELGRPATVNPVVLECNDGRLHDLRTLAVRPGHVMEALDLATGGVAAGDAAAGDGGADDAAEDAWAACGRAVAEGAVGAGHGMVAFGWKGGIGTASRVVDDGVWRATLGTLVLTNMGRPEELRVEGRRVAGPGRGPAPDPTSDPDPAAAAYGQRGSTPATPEGVPAQQPVGGSVIVVLATDAPFDARQLGRLTRRVQNGLARVGVTTDHGSGEIVLAFSTALVESRRDGSWLDPWSAAVAQVVQEAVLSSLHHATTTVGRDGFTAYRCPHV